MASAQEVIAPVISIFTPGLGPPVARGLLIKGFGVDYSGLFSPWPTSLAGKEFGIYVPAHEGAKAQWLAPKEVGIVEGDKHGGTFGVVSFTESPTREGGAASEEKFKEAEAQPNASRWDAVKASLANNLEMLAKLDGSLPNRKLIPKTAAMPTASLPVNVAGIKPGDFVCHYLLHFD